jgi:hypothetical protein
LVQTIRQDQASLFKPGTANIPSMASKSPRTVVPTFVVRSGIAAKAVKPK